MFMNFTACNNADLTSQNSTKTGPKKTMLQFLTFVHMSVNGLCAQWDKKHL